MLSTAVQDRAGARVRTISVRAEAYRGNRVGEPCERRVVVVLPADYEVSGRRYPVLYLLHGFGLNAARAGLWFGDGYAPHLDASRIPAIVHASGSAVPMILVCPDGGTWVGGGMWEDSPVSGHAARFVARELVARVDREFRTYAWPSLRGIAGHSMGGQGALRIVMRYPGIFGAVYSMSGMMSFSRRELSRYGEAWLAAERSGEPAERWTEMTRAFLAMCMAYCWRLGAGAYDVRWPVLERAGRVRLDEAACARFLSKWPEPTLRSSPGAARALRRTALAFDAAIDDEFTWGLRSNRRFVTALQQMKVPFSFSEYAGTHTSHLAERLTGAVLPFFADCFHARLREEARL